MFILQVIETALKVTFNIKANKTSKKLEFENINYEVSQVKGGEGTYDETLGQYSDEEIDVMNKKRTWYTMTGEEAKDQGKNISCI